MAKPDNRADNVEHLQKSINNTLKNHGEAEEYLAEHADEISPQDKQIIQEKNQRREKALQGLRSEIQDESEYQQNQ